MFAVFEVEITTAGFILSYFASSAMLAMPCFFTPPCNIQTVCPSLTSACRSSREDSTRILRMGHHARMYVVTTPNRGVVDAFAQSLSGARSRATPENIQTTNGARHGKQCRHVLDNPLTASSLHSLPWRSHRPHKLPHSLTGDHHEH